MNQFLLNNWALRNLIQVKELVYITLSKDQRPFQDLRIQGLVRWDSFFFWQKEANKRTDRVVELVEFAHLEEEDDVVVLGLEGPPLAHGRRQFVHEGLGHVQRPRVVVGVVGPPPPAVQDLVRPQELVAEVRELALLAGRRRRRTFADAAAAAEGLVGVVVARRHETGQFALGRTARSGRLKMRCNNKKPRSPHKDSVTRTAKLGIVRKTR